MKEGGGRGEGKLRFLGHLRILLFIAVEQQKLDRHKKSPCHWSRLFISFSKIQLSDTSEVLAKLYPDQKSQ